MHTTTDSRRQPKGLAPLLFTSLLIGGCGFTIIPQESLVDPAPVFVVDHGWHASLVLPAESGTVRYSYGDWRWYVLRETGAAAGFNALFRNSQAALVRREMVAPPTAEAVGQALHAEPEDVLPLEVERHRMTELRKRLEDIFEHNSSSVHMDSGELSLTSVHHPLPYSLRHNSNAVVAQWLRDMGVEVRGAGPFSHWRLADEP